MYAQREDITLHPVCLRVGTMFQGRVFRIPLNQRFYSWSPKQNEELFNDIMRVVCDVKLGGPSPPKFDHEEIYRLGTVHLVHIASYVIGQTTGGERVHVFDIIDGQQRSVSLMILAKVLLDLLRAYSGEDNIIKNIIKVLFTKNKEGLTITRFRFRKDTQDFFAKMIATRSDQLENLREECKIQAHHNLLDAAKTYLRLFKKRSEQKDDLVFKRFLNYFSQTVLLTLRVSVSTTKNVPDKKHESAILFDQLNNRGLPINELDKVKAMLFFYDYTYKFNLVDKIQSTWQYVYKTLERVYKNTDLTGGDNKKINPAYDPNVETAILEIYMKIRQPSLSDKIIQEQGGVYQIVKEEFIAIEEKFIGKIVTDQKSKEMVEKNMKDLKYLGEKFLEEIKHVVEIYVLLSTCNSKDFEVTHILEEDEDIIVFGKKFRNMFNSTAIRHWKDVSIFLISAYLMLGGNKLNNYIRSEIFLNLMKFMEAFQFKLRFIKGSRSNLGSNDIRDFSGSFYDFKNDKRIKNLIVNACNVLAKKIETKQKDKSIDRQFSLKSNNRMDKGLIYYMFEYELYCRREQNDNNYDGDINEMFNLIQKDMGRGTKKYYIGRILPAQWSKNHDCDPYYIENFGKYEDAVENNFQYDNNVGNLTIFHYQDEEDMDNLTHKQKKRSKLFSNSSTAINKQGFGKGIKVGDRVNKREKFLQSCEWDIDTMNLRRLDFIAWVKRRWNLKNIIVTLEGIRFLKEDGTELEYNEEEEEDNDDDPDDDVVFEDKPVEEVSALNEPLVIDTSQVNSLYLTQTNISQPPKYYPSVTQVEDVEEAQYHGGSSEEEDILDDDDDEEKKDDNNNDYF